MGVKSRRGKDLLVVIVENKYKKESYRTKCVDENRFQALKIKG